MVPAYHRLFASRCWGLSEWLKTYRLQPSALEKRTAQLRYSTTIPEFYRQPWNLNYTLKGSPEFHNRAGKKDHYKENPCQENHEETSKKNYWKEKINKKDPHQKNNKIQKESLINIKTNKLTQFLYF